MPRWEDKFGDPFAISSFREFDLPSLITTFLTEPLVRYKRLMFWLSSITQKRLDRMRDSESWWMLRLEAIFFLPRSRGRDPHFEDAAGILTLVSPIFYHSFAIVASLPSNISLSFVEENGLDCGNLKSVEVRLIE